ncbi:MAG: efflux RND transporter periplasmic adaptor subunit [Geminicoccaceae bacterium]|nr:efflux RND transporter periplasmic adaptor subunit [Geminicoccaceae bacterium]
MSVGFAPRPRIVACLLLAALLAACEREAEMPVPQVRPVRAIEVQPREVAEPVVLTGRIAAADEVALGFRIGGRLMERPVAMGQRVEPGQLIARLEPQNELNALRTAEANLAAAQGQLDEARSEYGRQRHLEERGWAARAVYERARQAFQTAQARVEAAKAQLELARDQLSFTELHADAAGVVVAVLAEPGEVVAAGRPIVRLAREGGRDAVFDVPASVIRRAPPDPLITVELAGDRRIRAKGRVREVAPEADPITRTFEVKIGLIDPPPEMRLGATVIGRMETAASEVLEIPASALFRHEGRPAVWVIDRATSSVQLRPVEVARYETAKVVLAAGLEPGERVVTAGVQALHPGQKVRLAGAGP